MYNRELVEYFLSYKLSQRNYPSSLLRPDDADGGAEEQRSPAALNSFLVSSRNRRVGIEAVKAALQDSTEEFEQLFAQTFDEFSPQLSITSYQTFKDVMDETFNDGVTWGRIVGLFAFGGVLCLKCAEKDAGKPVCHIADWMTIYLDEHINPWIQSQGGWVCMHEWDLKYVKI